MKTHCYYCGRNVTLEGVSYEGRVEPHARLGLPGYEGDSRAQATCPGSGMKKRVLSAKRYQTLNKASKVIILRVVGNLRDEGWTFKRIGEVLGKSPQYASVLYAKYRREAIRI